MDQFDRAMEALRGRFISRGLAEKRALQEAWAAGDTGAMQTIAHSLAGNGGVFGYHRLSRIAGQLEKALEGSAPSGEVRSTLSSLLAEIDECAKNQTGGAPSGDAARPSVEG